MPAPERGFARLLAGLRFPLTEEKVAKLAAYRDLLLDANRRINLTAVRDREGVERRLILESLRLVPALDRWLPATPMPWLIDIGSGGGIPGLVLAIARPDLAITLVEATGKKVEFLRHAIAALELEHATAIHGRAEELAHEVDHRGAFDIATARGVAALPALCELCLPFLRPGGVALLAKGIEIGDELAQARAAAPMLGGEVVEAPILPGYESEITTRLVVVRKTGPTPRAYPRHSGIPVKSPLGGSKRLDDERRQR